MNQIISPVKKVAGCLKMPGDKSISHRALMIAGVAEGVTTIENLAEGADVKSTMTCLTNLGVKIKKNKNQPLVYGKGLRGFLKPRKILNVGNSGTTIRLLTGLLAGQPFTSQITGDDSIRRRPMSRIVVPLKKMGADIQANMNEYAPLTIKGGALKAIHYKLPVASAQVKSCLLLAGLFANGTTVIYEPFPTRDHTERMLQNFGAEIDKESLKVSVLGPARLKAQKVFVPGDLSSAAFFIAAALLIKGSELKIENVGMNPTRKAFLSILSEMGAKMDILNFTNFNNEFMADIYVQYSKLKGFKIKSNIIPQIIDEIPIFALLATQARGTTVIKGATELRYKESDRLKAISSNLNKMGAQVQETEDGLLIQGPVKLQHAELDSFGDHRMA
ncbi:MAG: 3-phosphoshikimate 1-carboxyvinyltransferase, partial [bacterium]